MTGIYPNTKRVFLSYGVICIIGAIGFTLTRVYINYKSPEILAARERIHNAFLNPEENENTPLAYTKAYRDRVKQLQTEQDQKRSA